MKFTRTIHIIEREAHTNQLFDERIQNFLIVPESDPFEVGDIVLIVHPGGLKNPDTIYPDNILICTYISRPQVKKDDVLQKVIHLASNQDITNTFWDLVCKHLASLSKSAVSS